MIPTLDLFSGIGGFSYALKGICKTVAYCDADSTCVATLHKLIKRGLLEDAPIYEDVKELKGVDLKVKPVMITGGFPCQDLSSANPAGEGLKGERSGLFYEIVRLIKELPSVKIVFLENSPVILRKGMPQIKAAFKKLGFAVSYGIFYAKEVGALHPRRRWFCFAYKETDDTKHLLQDSSSRQGKFIEWDDEPCPRLIPKKNASNIDRCRMLGNSVVPKCVRYAFNVLSSAAMHKLSAGSQHDTDTVIVHNKSGKHYFLKPPSLTPELDINITMSFGKTTYIRQLWATPCRSIWHQYRNLTYRSAGVLSNQIYYEKSTKADGVPVNMRSKTWVVNPCFVEWLMGYPKDWTK